LRLGRSGFGSWDGVLRSSEVVLEVLLEVDDGCGSSGSGRSGVGGGGGGSDGGDGGSKKGGSSAGRAELLGWVLAESAKVRKREEEEESA